MRVAKNPHATLEGTGFDRFYAVLTQFLKEGRIRAEMRSARILASNTYREFHRKVTDRLGMLGNKSKFEENYEAVKPIFEDLRKIRDRVKNEFEQAERTEPQRIAASLSAFIRGLDADLRTEFAAYMPDLSYWQTLKLIAPGEQQKFTAQVKDAFAQFLQHKMPDWEREAMGMIENSIQRLQSVTEGYAIDYAVNMNAISERLTGGSVMDKHDITADDSPWWTRAVAGGAAFILGDPLGAGLAAHRLFNWRDVAKNIAVVVSSQVMLYLLTGGVLGPIGVIIVGLVAGICECRRCHKAVERARHRGAGNWLARSSRCRPKKRRTAISLKSIGMRRSGFLPPSKPTWNCARRRLTTCATAYGSGKLTTNRSAPVYWRRTPRFSRPSMTSNLRKIAG